MKLPRNISLHLCSPRSEQNQALTQLLMKECIILLLGRGKIEPLSWIVVEFKEHLAHTKKQKALK